jgi:hypothetical protein
LAAVPVTVYVVVAVGDTVTVAPVSDPGIQRYVEAPVALIAVVPPVQIEGDTAVAATVGEAFTVIKRVDVAEQPPVVPVTV